ncbi:MAG: outer membrane protein transport protein [Gemmatimonadota bacterium]
MIRRLLSATLVAAALLGTSTQSAYATDGHFLHGVGAINSAMGGAGVAAPTSLLGTFYLNPAGLLAFDGTRIEFSFEMFKADRTLSSGVPLPGGGSFSGATTSVSDFVPIPALGFSYRVSDKLAIGLGGLGIGGFGVNYAQDSSNPLLAPRPNGFSQVYSNYTLMKFTPAVAYAPTDRIWIGGALNVDWATLEVDPFPAASPAATSPTDAFYSRATATDGAFGFGFQVGLMWKATDELQLGAAFASEQKFEDFEFNALWENPTISDGDTGFGTFRQLSFCLNVPAVLSAGLGWQVTPSLLFAADATTRFYESADGFALADPNQPFDQFGAVQGFGWTDIWSISSGLQWETNDWLTLRGGYNWSENPVPDELTFINVAAPAIVQNHLTAGISLSMTPEMSLDLGYYKAFSNTGTGQMFGSTGPIEGTSVTNELSEDSILMGFSFKPIR